MQSALLKIGRIMAWFPLVLFVALLLNLYQVNLTQVSDPPSPNWSRSVPVDQTDYAGATVPIAAPDGTLFVATSRERSLEIHRAKDGRVVPGAITLPAQQPYRLALLATSQQIDFFWLEQDVLRHAAIGFDGQVTTPPETVTNGVQEVSSALVAGQPVAFVAGAQGISAWTHGSSGWQVAGDLKGQAVQLLSSQGRGGSAYVAYLTATGDQRQLMLTAFQDGRWQQPRSIQSIDLRQGKDSIDHIELTVDATWAYALYTKNYRDPQTGAVKLPTMIAAPLAAGAALPPVAMNGGPVAGGKVAGALLAPAAVTGTPRVAQAAYVAQVSDAFHRTVAPVVATFGDGKLQTLELGYKGYEGYRPALTAANDNVYLTFASAVNGGKWDILVASSNPAWRTILNGKQPGDASTAWGITVLTLLQAFLPFMVGLMIFACVFAVLLLAYMVAMSWFERNGRLIFGAGVGLGLIATIVTVQVFVGKTADTLPAWLSSGINAYLVGLLVALLVLPAPWARLVRQKYNSPLGTLTVWCLLSLGAISLVFGPFFGHG